MPRPPILPNGDGGDDLFITSGGDGFILGNARLPAFAGGDVAPNPEVYEPRGSMTITQEWDAVVYAFVVGVLPLSVFSLRCDPDGHIWAGYKPAGRPE